MLTKKEKKEYVFKRLDEILKPQGYYFVKTGLDPSFILKENDKISMCNEIFSREQYKDWLPYYEKLKERLKRVEPIYNV